MDTMNMIPSHAYDNMINFVISSSNFRNAFHRKFADFSEPRF